MKDKEIIEIILDRISHTQTPEQIIATAYQILFENNIYETNKQLLIVFQMGFVFGKIEVYEALDNWAGEGKRDE